MLFLLVVFLFFLRKPLDKRLGTLLALEVQLFIVEEMTCKQGLVYFIVEPILQKLLLKHIFVVKDF